MKTRRLVGPLAASLSFLLPAASYPAPASWAAPSGPASAGGLPGTSPTTPPTTTTTTTVPPGTSTTTVPASTTTTTVPPGTSTTTTVPPGTSTTTVPAPTTTTTLPGARAQRLLASAISAANSQRGFTWRATVRAGRQSEVASGQSGRAYGTQTISVAGAGGAFKLSVVLAGTKLFVEGDAAGLQNVLNLNATVAKQQAGKWILLAPAAGPVYQALSAGLTVLSATSAFDMVGSLQVLPERTLAGRGVLGIRGKRAAAGLSLVQTLFVRASGRPLPVELVTSVDGLEEHMGFADWGRRVQVVQPRHFAPWQKAWAA